jgi:hypothetical protein
MPQVACSFSVAIGLSERRAFLRHLAPLRKKRWVVYCKPPFSGPEAVLAYLSRYTRRVAISNRRLIRLDEHGVTFRYKDYRRDGADRQRVMTLSTDEFIRRFLLHVLPTGLPPHPSLRPPRQRWPHGQCRACSGVARCTRITCGQRHSAAGSALPCPCCGGRMVIIETFQRAAQARAPPPSHPFSATIVS